VAARTRFVDRLLQNPGRGMQRVAPPAPMSIHKRRLSPGSCRKSGDLRKIPPDFLCIRPGKHKTWVHMRGMSTRVLVLSGDMRGLSTDMARRRPILEESDPGLCVCGPTSGGCAPTSAACGSTSPHATRDFARVDPYGAFIDQGFVLVATHAGQMRRHTVQVRYGLRNLRLHPYRQNAAPSLHKPPGSQCHRLPRHPCRRTQTSSRLLSSATHSSRSAWRRGRGQRCLPECNTGFNGHGLTRQSRQ
jgi:hypothetical protein